MIATQHQVDSPVTVRSFARRSRSAFVLIVLVSALPALLEGFDTSLYNFGSPFIVHRLHATASLLGTVALGNALGIALFSLVGGYLFDHFSVKRTVVVSVVVFAAFTVVTGLAANPTLLFLSRFCVGIGIGMFQPAIVALLGDIFWETRARAASAFAVFFGAGLFAGPLLSAPFLPHYLEPFIISGVAAVVVVGVFQLVVPATYKAPAKRPVHASSLVNRNIVLLSFSIFLFGIVLFGYLGYYSDYLLKGLALPVREAGPISSMGGLGGLLCAFPIGYLADRLGRKRVVSFASALIVIGSVGMFSVSGQVAALVASTFVFGAGWGIYVDLVATLGQDSVDDARAGTITGWLFLVFNVGAMAGGPAFAALLPFGFATAGLLTLGIGSVASLVLTLFTRPVVRSNIGQETIVQEVEAV